MKESKSKIPEKSTSNIDAISPGQEIEFLKVRLEEYIKKYDEEKKQVNNFMVTIKNFLKGFRN